MFDISPLRPTYFLLAEPQTSPKIAPPSFFYKLGGAKLHSTSKACHRHDALLRGALEKFFGWMVDRGGNPGAP